ncbi:MAG TPA: acetate kinase [Gammaproteobacteria bacterium]|nr:acetate kinase [Gammaproteobacteria bacterium]
MNNHCILTINSGSSSLRASLFYANSARRNFHYRRIGGTELPDYGAAFEHLLLDLGNITPTIIAHRITHGGDAHEPARLLDAREYARLKDLVRLAPLHLPDNLLGADLCAQRFQAAQLACFDTAFHYTLNDTARRLPLPASLGLRKYGFHGLNYAHIARRLRELLGPSAHGRVIAAHLGNGASLCLLEGLCSTDTTMGLTPAGGIPMSTRSGDLDPGIMLELSKQYAIEDLTKFIYRQTGLYALSDNLSGDMETLLASNTPQANFAIDYFCYQVRGAIGALAAKAGGIDVLVFSGGIGEHAHEIRAAICDPLAFLGIALDSKANLIHDTWLNTPDSKPILCIPADEEETMILLAKNHIAQHGTLGNHGAVGANSFA